jgi:hypothetical protein
MYLQCYKSVNLQSGIKLFYELAGYQVLKGRAKFFITV